MKKILALLALAFLSLPIFAQDKTPPVKDAQPPNHPRGRVQSSPEVLQKRHVEAFQRHRYRVMVRSSEVKVFPDKFDARQLGWTTDPTDQGNCGDCYGDSACRVYSAQRKKAGFANIFTFQYGLDWHHEFGGCSGGDEGEVIDFFKKTGWPDTTAYPFPYTASPGGKRAIQGPLIKLEDYGYCTPGQGQGIAAVTDIMTMIMLHGEVSTAVVADSLWDSYNGGGVMTYRAYSANQCNHAISILGWVKDASVKNGGYWIARNNWGKSWGINGDLFIAFGSHAMGAEAIWTSSTPLAPPPPDPPNPPAPPTPTPPIIGASITFSMDMKAGTYKLVDQNAAVLDEADLAALKALLAKLKMGPIEALKEATKEPPVNTSSKRLDEMEKNMLLLTNEVIKLQKLIVDQPKKTSQLNSPVQKEFDYAVYPDIRMSDAVRIERHLSRFAHRAPGSSRGQQQHDSQYADRA